MNNGLNLNDKHLNYIFEMAIEIQYIKSPCVCYKAFQNNKNPQLPKIHGVKEYLYVS